MTRHVPDLSIIFSTHLSPSENEIFKVMLRKSSGLSKNSLEILMFENYNQFSLSEIYNKGLNKAQSNIVLFIHNDVIFLEENWAYGLLYKINNSDFGILGIAGTTELLEKRDRGAWFNTGISNTSGLIFHPSADATGVEELQWGEKVNFLVPAVAIDGVFMLVNKSKIKLNFDEEFKGFHFYDISFCIRNFIAGVKIGIIADYSLKLYHNSTGKLSPEWDANRNLFLDKYPGNFRSEIVLSHCRMISTTFDYKDFHGKVHIIILTKNNVRMLFDLLESILETTKYSDYYVWIGDTGSTEDNKQLMKNKLIKLNDANPQKTNSATKPSTPNLNLLNFLDIGYYHYSKVNNAIVSYLKISGLCSKEDLILFCNDDVKLLNNCIDGCILEYVKLMKKGVKIGTLGIRLLFENNRIQHLGMDAFKRYDNRIYISHRYFGFAYRSANGTVATIGNTGAFMMVSLETFEAIGGFNENYIDAYQDVEFNFDCIAKGFTNFTVEYGVAYHYESITRRNDPDIEAKSKSDWSNLLFPYIIKNRILLNYFRTESIKFNISKNKMFKIDFANRTFEVSSSIY